MNISDTKATLSFSDGSTPIDMPIYKGTVGPDVIDIRKLYAQTGKFTYDPGFMSTAACNSSITYIDGDKGELLYRGYPIEQLAVNCDFLETCFLLLNGELPNKEENLKFSDTVTKHTMVHEQMQFFFRGFRRDAHPMSVLVGTVGALASFYHDSLDINDPHHREVSAIRLIAKMPTLAAMSHKYSVGQPFVYPRNDLSFSGQLPAHDVLGNPVPRITWSTPSSNARMDKHVHPARRSRAERLDIDRTSGRFQQPGKPFRLYRRGGHRFPVGPRSWRRQPGRSGTCCTKSATNREHSRIRTKKRQGQRRFRRSSLMGFGHRVYKNFDPRAKVMRETCHEVLERARHPATSRCWIWPWSLRN